MNFDHILTLTTFTYKNYYIYFQKELDRVQAGDIEIKITNLGIPVEFLLQGEFIYNDAKLENTDDEQLELETLVQNGVYPAEFLKDYKQYAFYGLVGITLFEKFTPYFRYEEFNRNDKIEKYRKR